MKKVPTETLRSSIHLIYLCISTTKIQLNLSKLSTNDNLSNNETEKLKPKLVLLQLSDLAFSETMSSIDQFFDFWLTSYSFLKENKTTRRSSTGIYFARLPCFMITFCKCLKKRQKGFEFSFQRFSTRIISAIAFRIFLPLSIY